jgi:PHD/YefM family antitoxin component YafN of YafNO toxin-antitoxin module
MTSHRRQDWAPIDADLVRLVLQFLRREFRDCRHRDYFAAHERAHVFVVETERGDRHMLVIPEATFQAEQFTTLLNAGLAATLARARNSRVTLTRDGPAAP